MKEMKRLLKSLGCKIGIHDWRIGFGWSNPKRFDTCKSCNKNRWVLDVKGNIELHKEIKQFEENKPIDDRDRKIDQILNG
jgi:hypothetical protein